MKIFREISDKSRKFILLLTLILSVLGCQTKIPSATEAPSQPKLATATDADQQGSQEQTVSTATSEVPESTFIITPVTASQTETAFVRTNDQGITRFKDPLSGKDLAVEFKDEATGEAVAGIDVWFSSNGPKVLVIARDPSGVYATMIKELTYDQLSSSPVSEKMAKPSDALGLVEVIWLVKVYNFFQDLSEWRAYLAQFPELKEWSTAGVSICINPLQIGEGEKLVLKMLGGIALSGGTPVVEGLALVLEEAFLDEQIDQLTDEAFQEVQPVIFDATLFSFNGLIPNLVEINGFCLDWLDKGDPQSALDWLVYGIENQDLYALTAITPTDDFYYANYIEGGQMLSSQTFLNHLKERLTSHPACDGYMIEEYRLMVWFSNWSPAWEMTEMCYVECNMINPPYESRSAGFFLVNRDGEWNLRNLYLNTPDIFIDVYGDTLYSCSTPYDLALSVTPTSTLAGDESTCPGAPPQQLQVNKRGYVCTQSDSVLLRDAPNRSANEITRLPSGTEFLVIDGPECANNWSWWKVQTDSGIIGWMAEGGDQMDPYFLCPIP